jgi:hypothetical protein
VRTRMHSARDAHDLFAHPDVATRTFHSCYQDVDSLRPSMGSQAYPSAASGSESEQKSVEDASMADIASQSQKQPSPHAHGGLVDSISSMFTGVFGR